MVPLTISKASKLILFFPQMVCWNFSSRNLDFYKGFHLWTIDCVTVFQGLLCCGQEKLELVHEPLQGPHLGPKSGCQLPNAWVAQIPPRPLGVWCCTTASSKTLFSMDGCQIFVVRDILCYDKCLYHLCVLS